MSIVSKVRKNKLILDKKNIYIYIYIYMHLSQPYPIILLHSGDVLVSGVRMCVEGYFRRTSFI